MKVEENEYLVIYPGHNIAALLYQRLLKKSCNVELVSTPVKITYGCSKSIRFKEVYIDIIRGEIRKIDTKPKGIYRIVKKGKSESYEMI
ncbi:MAG: DUF3343 domain-containing protein [Clostridiaceae bacterium]|nr:DUF3343 domain-containing protein [Clostridiaceae bacterium]